MRISKIALGGNSYIGGDKIFSQIIDLFSFRFLKNIRLNTSKNQHTDKTIYYNEQFWNKVINGNIVPEQIIRLRNFNVLEWVPLSPGKYFTDAAIESRNEGMQYIVGFSKKVYRQGNAHLSPKRKKYNDPILELDPYGKTKMVDGGLGSIRLTSKNINNKEMYFVCASSSGVSHEGIPILIEPNTYSKLIDTIKDSSCLDYEIITRVKTICKYPIYQTAISLVSSFFISMFFRSIGVMF